MLALLYTKVYNGFMNTLLKKALDSRGITVLEASKKGASYQTLRKQYLGERAVGLKTVLLYERILDIPRYELRPDLWPSPFSEDPLPKIN